jgi:hypothetical protein
MKIMGYCMDMTESKFFIEESNCDKAFEVLKNTAKQGTFNDMAWVNVDSQFLNQKHLTNAWKN